ncbi:MAG: DUF4388 domain-containing protein [Thermodesulfobacteriota bacterium]|nr:DUF4388 domain-containing protein [Thermodesulfobacteriota bacterium]
MALEGDLEDLGLCDILQILSLSKKTGILTLKSQQGEGLVCFMDGQVIRATSSFFPETLGQLLCRAEIVTNAQVDEALRYQQTLSVHQPLGKILVGQFHITSAQIEPVVAAQIETIVFSFFSWTEGRFSFRLEEMQAFGRALLNPLDFMLEKGLSSQRLVIKGKKITELGRDCEIDDESIERELVELQKYQNQQGLELLRGMLAELEHPEFGGGIILLILRYASEIMSRAIVFDVRGNQLVGLGQFGLTDLSVAADDIVRKMRLHVDAGSLFARVLKEKVVVRAALQNSAAEKSLQIFLNGTPEEVFMAPLISDSKVVALLYGDNFPASQPIRTAKAFEVFLSQAGLAMEQAVHGTG